MDAMLLYSESPNLHAHTLKVAIVDTAEFGGTFDFEVFRDVFRQRLSMLEPLRYKLVEIPWRLHHPMWLENCEIGLDYHLRRVAVPVPGGRRELDQVIGDIASAPLDRSRPLWEFHFAEGLADGRFALIGKVHHALADGVASANLLARALDQTEPVEHQPEGHGASLSPSAAGLLRTAARDHVRQLGELPGVMKDALAGLRRLRRRSRGREYQPDLARLLYAPATFLNHVVSPVRTFASTTLALAQVKRVAKNLDITINDVVLAIAAGALRELLLRYDGSADDPIVASILASTDKSPDRVSGNELSGMAVSLPVHIADPLERIRLTSLSSRIAKENFELLGPQLVEHLDIDCAYSPGCSATCPPPSHLLHFGDWPPGTPEPGSSTSPSPTWLGRASVAATGVHQSARSIRLVRWRRVALSTSRCGATSTSSISASSPMTPPWLTLTRRPTRVCVRLPRYAVLRVSSTN